MMLSHRYELNDQAAKAFAYVCGEDVDIEQAHLHADKWGRKERIVVASVQTLNSRSRGKYRMEKFDPFDFGLILIDEAHRAAAASYRRVLDYFKANPAVKILGVTATPDRLDKVGLNVVFEQVACDLNIRWAVENGWLVAPKQSFVQIDGLDLRQVKTVAGDLDQNQLARLVEQEQNLHAMAAPIVDITGSDKQSIVFTASVPQAHRLAELIRDYHFRKFGVGGDRVAVSLDGSLNPQDPRRLAIVREFKSGEIKHLVNCGVATEGFDAPKTSVIAMGRPTKSRALYTQCIGRGTRPLPGVVDGLTDAEQRIAAIKASLKPHCMVLDFVGQSGTHSLVCTTDILAGDGEPAEVQERAKRIQSNPGFDGNALEAMVAAKEQLAQEREARRAKVTVGVNYKLVEAQSLYDMATLPQVQVPNYMKKARVTPKQKGFMLKLGFTSAQIDQMNPRSASAAIDHALKNPKNAFARWLQKQKAKNQQTSGS